MIARRYLSIQGCRTPINTGGVGSTNNGDGTARDDDRNIATKPPRVTMAFALDENTVAHQRQGN